jgi:hypothetical protein
MITALTALAAQIPLVLGTVQNQAGSWITFTTYQGNCEGDDKVAFTQSSGGKVELTGCYRIVGDQLFVIWADGDIYTYKIEHLTFSREMLKWLEEQ